ncbi:MAG: hypothetical protein ABIJ16_02120 [Bacteroidota bacterium]
MPPKNNIHKTGHNLCKTMKKREQGIICYELSEFQNEYNLLNESRKYRISINPACLRANGGQGMMNDKVMLCERVEDDGECEARNALTPPFMAVAVRSGGKRALALNPVALYSVVL